MTLDQCREEIEAIDKLLVESLLNRMEVVRKVAEVKLENNLEILDEKREEDLLLKLVESLDDDIMEGVIRKVYGAILSTSRQIQMQYIDAHSKNVNR